MAERRCLTAGPPLGRFHGASCDGRCASLACPGVVQAGLRPGWHRAAARFARRPRDEHAGCQKYSREKQRRQAEDEYRDWRLSSVSSACRARSRALDQLFSGWHQRRARITGEVGEIQIKLMIFGPELILDPIEDVLFAAWQGHYYMPPCPNIRDMFPLRSFVSAVRPRRYRIPRVLPVASHDSIPAIDHLATDS